MVSNVGNLMRGAWDGQGHRIRICFVGNSVKQCGHPLSGEIGDSRESDITIEEI